MAQPTGDPEPARSIRIAVMASASRPDERSGRADQALLGRKGHAARGRTVPWRRQPARRRAEQPFRRSVACLPSGCRRLKR